MKTDKKAFDFFKSQGPEIMKEATGANVKGQVIANLTASVSEMIMANASDSDPKKIS